MVHVFQRNRFQLAERPKHMAELMNEFVQSINPNKYLVTDRDKKLLIVWKAEANFLACFEDIFDL